MVLARQSGDRAGLAYALVARLHCLSDPDHVDERLALADEVMGLTGGRAVAIVSGAYSVSSNRSDPSGAGDFGGGGWVIDPDGRVLALTTPEEPFHTVAIDLGAADAAKSTYPRYALD